MIKANSPTASASEPARPNHPQQIILLKTILLTGPSGFIGQRFITFNAEQYRILPTSVRLENASEIDFTGVDAVVHLAGKAHSMEKIEDEIYFLSNRDLTKVLAEAAKKANVKQFILMSTVNVYLTEATEDLINEKTERTPQTPYGESKRQAEDELQKLKTPDFKIAIIRPPLVYGPGVKGNLLRFLDLANKNWPLPFSNVKNKRSMVYVDNLIALTNAVIDQESSGIFLATDAQTISTEHLMGSMRRHLGRPENLFPLPKLALLLLYSIKPTIARRLFGNFIIDSSDSFKRLNFTPPFPPDQGLREMCEWYLKHNQNDNHR